MARGNGKDLIGLLVHDVELLKQHARDSSDELKVMSAQMTSLSDTMTSLSETMSELSKTMGIMGRAMAKQVSRGNDQEKLYSRLAKTLIAFKDTTDDRFDDLESRMHRLERGSTRH